MQRRIEPDIYARRYIIGAVELYPVVNILALTGFVVLGRVSVIYQKGVRFDIICDAVDDKDRLSLYEQHQITLETSGLVQHKTAVMFAAAAHAVYLEHRHSSILYENRSIFMLRKNISRYHQRQ